MALQTSVQQLIVVSEANFDLKFEISNLNYTGLYVYIAILVAPEAMAASGGQVWPQNWSQHPQLAMLPCFSGL